jgi:hypothetical protein
VGRRPGNPRIGVHRSDGDDAVVLIPGGMAKRPDEPVAPGRTSSCVELTIEVPGCPDGGRDGRRVTYTVEPGLERPGQALSDVERRALPSMGQDRFSHP